MTCVCMLLMAVMKAIELLNKGDRKNLNTGIQITASESIVKVHTLIYLL